MHDSGLGVEGSLEWLAGLWEGEGCFTMTKSQGRIRPCATLAMVDEDIIRRAQRVGGTGTVASCGTPKGGRQEVWRWSSYGYQAVALALRLYPYLGSRRKSRISEILGAWMSQPQPRNHQREKTHCRHGHPYDEANTYHYVKDGVVVGRLCRTCRLAESRRRRERNRRATGVRATTAA